MTKKRRTTSCAVVPRGAKVQICVRRSGEPGQSIGGPEDACKILRGAANADRESFVTMYLDAKNRVVGVDESHKGSLVGVDVHPREIFKGALATNAAAVVVSHNHPSGETDPSQQDLMLTKRLTDAGKMIGIPVLDHVIVGKDKCLSLREHDDGLFGSSGIMGAAYPKVDADTGVTSITGMYRPKAEKK